MVLPFFLYTPTPTQCTLVPTLIDPHLPLSDPILYGHHYSVFNQDYLNLIMYLSVFVHQANISSAVYKAQGKINAHNLCLYSHRLV